jgi:hypothetical protein
MKKILHLGNFGLTGLTSGVNYTYQVLGRRNNSIANSPLVKRRSLFNVGLSPYDDGGIPAASYPNMPVSIQ